MAASLSALLSDPKVIALLIAIGIGAINFIRSKVANGGTAAFMLDKVLALIPDFQKLFGTTNQPLPGGVADLAEAATVLKDTHS